MFRTTPVPSRSFRALAIAVLLAGCNGTDTEPSSIGLALSTSTAALTQGGSATATATVTRVNFDGDVVLSATGMPSGVTATFSPTTLAGGATQSTLTLSALSTAAPGTATITVRAAGNGVTDQTATIALTLQAAPAYTLTPSATTLALANGATGTVSYAIARTNFTAGVNLAVSGLPTGATASFAPNPATGDASVLTINAGTAAAGTYALNVTGSATGLTDRVSPLTLTIAAPSSYTLALASTSGSLAVGASSTVNVTLTRTNFTGPVTLAASGVPAGATVTFAPNPATANSSVMTINTGTAAPGTYTITVTATAAGLTDRTATFALTITAPSGFVLTTTPGTLSVVSGASGTTSVGIDRTSFTGDVTLTVAGLPTGATGTFAPNPASGATSVLTINTGSAAPGTYPLTITGAATGLTNRTTTATLTITAAASTNVGFVFCADRLPAWVAYQSGTGPWTQASVGANNTYSFNIAGRGGVAVVRPTNGVSAAAGYSTEIIYASAAELQSIGTNNCATPVLGTRTVNGTVAGAGTDMASVVLGNAQASTFGNGPFTLDSVLNGPHDLLATLMSTTSLTVTKMIIRRALDPANGSTLPVLDFSSSEAFALSPSTLLLPGVAASTQVFVSSIFSTANGSSALTGFSTGAASAATYTGVPVTIAGDLQEVLAEAMETNGMRGAITYFVGTGTRTLTLGPPLSTPTVTSLGITPYPRLRVQYASQAEYNAIGMALFHQGGSTSASTDRDVSIVATPGYFGGVPATWDLSIPDLTAAAGFNTSWMLAPATSTEVTTAGYGGNILTTAPTVGTTIYFAQHTGVVVTTSSTVMLQRLAPSRRSATKVAAQNNRVLQIMHNRRSRGLRR